MMEGPLEVELQKVITTLWVLGAEPGPLQERPVLLITEPSLQHTSGFSAEVVGFEPHTCSANTTEWAFFFGLQLLTTFYHLCLPSQDGPSQAWEASLSS